MKIRKHNKAFYILICPVFIAILSIQNSTAIDSSSYREAITKVEKQMEEERKALSAIQLSIGEERTLLRQSLISFQGDIKTAENELADLEKENQKITLQIEKAQVKNDESLRQFDRLWESLKFNIREFNGLYSLTLPEKNEIQHLKEMMATSNVRGGDFLQLLEALHTPYLKFFEKASSIMSLKANVYNETGQPVIAKTLQIGLLGGIYWSDNGSGLIYFKPGGNHLESLSAGLSKRQQRLLKSSADQSSGIIPVLLDVSQGWALRQLGLRKGWKEFFISGGFVMFPLAAIAIISLIMVLERSIFYWLFSRSNSKLKRSALSILRNKNYDEASTIVTTHNGPSKRFWKKCVELLKKKSASIDEAFQHVIIAEIPSLERFLTTLAVFAAICPLLGLLGTVSGMIKTFDVITVFGTGQQGLLSQGISEALVTTQVGLVLAIPILLAHAILARRSKLIIESLDQTAGAIIESLKDERVRG